MEPVSSTPPSPPEPGRPGAAAAEERRQPVAAPDPPLPPGSTRGGPPPVDMSEVVAQLSDYVQNHRRSLEFTVDETTGRAVIRVLDADTGELVRQIPPEEVLELARILKERTERSENAHGLLLRVRT